MKSPGYRKPTHQYGLDSEEQEGPVGEVPALPWDDPEIMARDLRHAARDIEDSGRPGTSG